MKRKGILVIAITILLALSLTLGGCFALLNTVLDNLNTVFSLVDPSVEEGALPEGAVYGSDNDIAVGFDNGSIYAFWDDYGEYDYTLTVTKGDIDTEYDTEADADLFSGTSFDLKTAGYAYSDDLTVKLTRIYVNPDYDGTEGSERYLY